MSLSRLFLLGVALLAASGCGFRPLYAPPAEDAEGRSVYAFDLLRGVEIANIPDREGQYLYNQLSRLLHPQGRGGATTYVLNVTLAESTTSLAVQKNALATRANLSVRGSFSLAAVGRPAVQPGQGQAGANYSGLVTVTSGYNIYDSEFQTLAAKKGARERALDDLAQQVRTQVATFLTAGSTLPARP